MIRLTLILCAGLFAAMLIAGEDRGQQRFGLIPRPTAKSVEVVIAEAKPDAEVAQEPIAPAQSPALLMDASFAPEAPVMGTPLIADTTVAPTPEIVGRIVHVNTKSLNVRSGPGTDFDVTDRLQRGVEVLVVSEAETPDGWAMIRIEGDGVEGYVSARLLSE
ncbi:MAG: SH3 domain-containing protein [Cypionkella sp.]